MEQAFAEVAPEGVRVEENRSVEEKIAFLHTFAFILLQNEEYEKAVMLFQAWTADEPDNPLAWSGLAICHHKLGEPKEALRAAERAISSDNQMATGGLSKGARNTASEIIARSRVSLGDENL